MRSTHKKAIVAAALILALASTASSATIASFNTDTSSDWGAGNPDGTVEKNGAIELFYDSWRQESSMPTSRWDLAAATGGNGNVYAIGGTSVSIAMGEVEMYDPLDDTWSTVDSLAENRTRLAAVEGPNGDVYAIGGQNSSYEDVSTVEEYDVGNGAWTTIASMPTARQKLAAATANGSIYAIGGEKNDNVVDTVEMYDHDTGWSTVTSMPTARKDVAAAVGPNDNIYVIGGDDGGGVTSTVEVYDPETDSWSAASSMPTARDALRAVTLNGNIYAIGGYDGSGDASVVEMYDPGTDSWSEVTNMPGGRSSFGAVAKNDSLYTIGGLDGDTDGSTTLFRYGRFTSGNYRSQIYTHTEQVLWNNLELGDVSQPGASDINVTVTTYNDGSQVESTTFTDIADGASQYSTGFDQEANEVRFRIDMVNGSVPSAGNVTVSSVDREPEIGVPEIVWQKITPYEATDVTFNRINDVGFDELAGGRMVDEGKTLIIVAGPETRRFSLSTPYDFTTRTLENTYEIDENLKEIFFDDDGDRMYGVNFDGKLHQYSLSTPYHPSTETLEHTKDISSTTSGRLRAGWRSPDGSKFYVIGQDESWSAGANFVHQYTLSTPWDLSTASLDGHNTVKAPDSYATFEGMQFSPDGNVAQFIQSDANYIYERSLSEPYDILTWSDAGQTQLEQRDALRYGFDWFDGGKKFFTLQSYSDVHKFEEYNAPSGSNRKLNVPVDDKGESDITDYFGPPSGTVTAFSNSSLTVDGWDKGSFDWSATVDDAVQSSPERQIDFTSYSNLFVQNDTGTVNTTHQAVKGEMILDIRGGPANYSFIMSSPQDVKTSVVAGESSGTQATGNVSATGQWMVDTVSTTEFDQLMEDTSKQHNTTHQYAFKAKQVSNNGPYDYNDLYVPPIDACCATQTDLDASETINVTYNASQDWVDETDFGTSPDSDEVTFGQDFSATRTVQFENTNAQVDWSSIQTTGMPQPQGCVQQDTTSVELPASFTFNASIGYSCSSGDVTGTGLTSTEAGNNTRYWYNASSMTVESNVTSETRLVWEIPKDNLTGISDANVSSYDAWVDSDDTNMSIEQTSDVVRVKVGTNRGSSLYEGDHDASFTYVTSYTASSGDGSTGGGGGGGGGGGSLIPQPGEGGGGSGLLFIVLAALVSVGGIVAVANSGFFTVPGGLSQGGRADRASSNRSERLVDYSMSMFIGTVLSAGIVGVTSVVMTALHYIGAVLSGGSVQSATWLNVGEWLHLVVFPIAPAGPLHEVAFNIPVTSSGMLAELLPFIVLVPIVAVLAAADFAKVIRDEWKIVYGPVIFTLFVMFLYEWPSTAAAEVAFPVNALIVKGLYLAVVVAWMTAAPIYRNIRST